MALALALGTFLSIGWAVCLPDVNVWGFPMTLLSTVVAWSLIFPLLVHFVDLTTSQLSTQNLETAVAGHAEVAYSGKST